MTDKRQVVLGVTGSIAAYKAAELARVMIKRGWSVKVVMTQAATHFITPLTFRTLTRHPVALDMFAEPANWNPAHIALADWAQALLIAPCTANVLAKLAAGLADDTLTATALACTAPLIVAPAMNGRMWQHPATRENAERLLARGATLVNVATGELACGQSGSGRLAELPDIVAAVDRALQSDSGKTAATET